MPTRTPTPCTVFRLRKATRKATRAYDRHLAAYGVGISQFGLLRIIADNDAAPLNRIAQILDMERTTLTRNLRPLLSAGLVELRTGKDKRIRTISITPEGRCRLEAAAVAWRAAQAEMRRRMGDEDLDRLHRLLTLVVERLPED